MVRFIDQMKAGMMHDHMEMYSVKFWYTNQEGYRATKTHTLYIEEGDPEAAILKCLRQRYTKPEIISVKYQ